ncbi:MAG: hypothetical protein HC836_08365 [Richelia sp. RM2_1_2]|nr:hypothetical protein [Richelia sp. SM2_1_7]NJM17790.1 hypothetical protein [Richelia sp. SM1_7_0]NJN08707.1 hypothetical protein [Richelia sp. RM1_1_1]NJO27888.1 hypothetical protein [Richelia sp. SL_2_1]NJO58358.1 hypothetical protein [Richelia sp. RM2_1_2]
MQEVKSQNPELENRILPIVEKLIQENSLYQVKLNKAEMVEMLVDLFGEFSSEEFRAIKNDDLTKRIDSILVVEAVSGTLNDLTPEEIAIFDEAVEGR